MSLEYPCVYYDHEKCTLHGSEPEYIDWCVMGPCSKETPSNADHIRSMTDEELAEFLMSDICGTVSPKDFDCYGACIDCATIWLKQPYKEEV